MNRQWVVDAHRAGTLTLTADAGRVEAAPRLKCRFGHAYLRCGRKTLVVVRRCLPQVNHRQQHEHIRLNHRYAQMQSKKDDRYKERNQ